MRIAISLAVALLLVIVGATPAAAGPYAVEVVRYTEGTGAGTRTDPATALGAPALDTGFGDVSLVNPAFNATQIVSIGGGGELVVRFDQQVVDDAANPFGLDLIVFGNAFFTHPGNGVIGGAFDLDSATISVSQDDVSWFDLPLVSADSLFPTHAFVDTSAPTGFANASDGTIQSDFERPVDPSLELADFVGLTFDQAVALYAGSGGGTGVDIGSVGLAWIEYVRITPNGAAAVEIDAFADVRAVPEPALLLLLGLGLPPLLRPARRRATAARARTHAPLAGPDRRDAGSPRSACRSGGRCR